MPHKHSAHFACQPCPFQARAKIPPIGIKTKAFHHRNTPVVYDSDCVNIELNRGGCDKMQNFKQHISIFNIIIAVIRKRRKNVFFFFLNLRNTFKSFYCLVERIVVRVNTINWSCQVLFPLYLKLPQCSTCNQNLY